MVGGLQHDLASDRNSECFLYEMPGQMLFMYSRVRGLNKTSLKLIKKGRRGEAASHSHVRRVR